MTISTADALLHDTISLGDLIAKLEIMTPETQVYYDFVGAYPTTLASSRGLYECLALGWEADGPHDAPTVQELLEHLRAAVGSTFEGYKGGQYRMDERVAVFVDNWGRWTETRITDVGISEYARVFIRTEMDFD